MSLIVWVALVPIPAFAQPADDGYCDYVEGSAAATAAPLMAPELYGLFGRIEQPTFTVIPDGDAANLRVIGGIRYSLINLLSGIAIRQRAHADCRRHIGLAALRGAMTARALEARIRVYDDAIAEAERILKEVNADLEARRTTAPEATATRLRVEELRTLSSRAKTELAALPQDARPVSSMLTTYRTADDDMEASEGRLRLLNAFDFSLRAGFERFLNGPNQETEFVGVVQIGINLGALWVPGNNARAAAGRRRYARTNFDALGPNETAQELRSRMDLEARRMSEVSALVTDLGQQLDSLGKLGGEDSKRFRQTIWFDWIEAKAELAYLQAYVATIGEVLGVDATAR
ncbi:MAG: hypothetical protein HOV81_38145 [Kofleriaceae bacterium]|nr:hypothetical protein [Kofleriaceae bacterium]